MRGSERHLWLQKGEQVGHKLGSKSPSEAVERLLVAALGECCSLVAAGQLAVAAAAEKILLAHEGNCRTHLHTRLPDAPVSAAAHAAEFAAVAAQMGH